MALDPPPEVTKRLDSGDCASEFLAIQDELSDDRYWAVLRWAWLRHGASFARENVIDRVFKSGRPGREHLMTENEREMLARLPDTMVVYQGGTSSDAGFKWSWSLERQKAKNFAINCFGRHPRLVEGIVSKSDVTAYFGEYDEQEVLVEPGLVRDRHYTDDYASTGPLSGDSDAPAEDEDS